MLDFETAGVGSRVLARLVDGAVLTIALVVFTLAMEGLVTGRTSTTVGVVVTVLVIAFVVFGYWMLFETFWSGRTLGKAALGLRVVTVEGAPIRFRHAAIRAMLGLVDFLLPPLGPVAVVSVVASARNQRLGDLAAGTIVLRGRAHAEPARALALLVPPESAEVIAALSLARITEQQYNLVRRFLLRIPQLTPWARAQLATDLAGRVSTTTGVACPPSMHPEWFLHAAGIAHHGPAAGPFGVVGRPAPPPPPPSGPRRG